MHEYYSFFKQNFSSSHMQNTFNTSISQIQNTLYIFQILLKEYFALTHIVLLLYKLVKKLSLTVIRSLNDLMNFAHPSFS